MNCKINNTYIPNKYFGWWLEKKQSNSRIGKHILMRSQTTNGILIKQL